MLSKQNCLIWVTSPSDRVWTTMTHWTTASTGFVKKNIKMENKPCLLSTSSPKHFYHIYQDILWILNYMEEKVSSSMYLDSSVINALALRSEAP